MRTKSARRKAGSFFSALLIGVFFGIFLVVCQEIIYQYQLEAQYTEGAQPGSISVSINRVNNPSGAEEGTTGNENEQGAAADKQTVGYQQDSDSGDTLITVGNEIITINFADLKAVNPEFIGWVFIPGTDVSYPVVQGENNFFYLDHVFNKTYSTVGTLFADYRNMAMEDENTIIYGHNFSQYGAMFSKLVYYESQDWYNEHPVIYFLTEKCGYAIEVFSAYEAATTDPVYTLTFYQSADFEDLLNHMEENSMIETSASVTTADKLVTFSTCSNRDSEGRFVVVGKIIPFYND